ncbi:hypothetical protein MSG28_008726 [Choristoneura fumiferana]|uniref:Uncharacterized protein n=1 Tax=Choristoneura fumiferana TaxID=7141 RepID=A0ACC0J7R5_CHOFU|nr:hypothetical protein MSG28_008726 [Choristoneura fumiferana]
MSNRRKKSHHHHHPSLYTSHCWAQASSQNKRAWAIVPTRAQCGLGTSHAPLNCFADVPCGAAQCAEHGAGADAADACACACPHRAPLFREDRELCVDDLPECSLASFGTGAGVQRIPFVYLPLKGQIIHPSKDITFQGVKTPICAVSGAQFLTPKGFVDLRNTLDADVPFSLFRDEGRTFLQWSGEDDVRARMSGRMMVVRLLCRDVAAAPASPLDLRGVFTPCVAFRVQGTPPKPMSNVTEVQFAPNAQTSQATTTSGLSVTEYVAIGISSLLLGLIYVASVFLYLHIRKRKKVGSEDSSRRLKSLKNKDGSIITERDIVRINNERVPSLPSSLDLDDGLIKNNPLMGLSRQFHQIKHSFPSDSGSTLSDSEDFADGSVRSDDHMFKDQTTSALIHSHHSKLKLRNTCPDLSHRDESGIERLPDEHVSIVETTDDREIARPVGTTRRKLYFNPAYFEPHLMAEPPPAALEFLTKIREVIAVAKHKMAAKRFQPVLNEIPEEETYPSRGNSLDIYQAMGSQRSGSVVSLKRENSRKRSLNCVGCPGYEEKFNAKMNNTTARKTSESPPVNDYETDSLERTSTKKSLSTPPEYPEISSSQASPSLSNALPLEEELTMTNAVYKTQSSSNSNTPSPQRDICMEQNHYETIDKKKSLNNADKTMTTKNSSDNSYSLVSEVYVNNNYNFGSTPTSPSGSECSMGSRKLHGTLKNSQKKPGCLTIEVKDPPENYIKIHESDGFEPDTLDRKNSKHKEIVENIQFSRTDLIKNLDSNGSPINHRIQLRSSGTFKKAEADHSASKFSSLRYDYETRKNIYERPKLLSTTFNYSKSLEDTTEPWEMRLRTGIQKKGAY